MMGNLLRVSGGGCQETGEVVWSCCARASVKLIDIDTFRNPRHHEIEVVEYISDSVQVSTNCQSSGNG